jgi:hypothetical protein
MKKKEKGLRLEGVIIADSWDFNGRGKQTNGAYAHSKENRFGGH